MHPQNQSNVTTALTDVCPVSLSHRVMAAHKLRLVLKITSHNAMDMHGLSRDSHGRTAGIQVYMCMCICTHSRLRPEHRLLIQNPLDTQNFKSFDLNRSLLVRQELRLRDFQRLISRHRPVL